MVKRNIPSGSGFEPEDFYDIANRTIPKEDTFCEIVNRRLVEYGFIKPNENLRGKTSNKELSFATHLSGTICSKIKRESNYKPAINLLLAFCIGVGFSVDEIHHLLRLKGYALSPEDSVHRAYSTLLNLYDIYDISVEQCNACLDAWGIEKKHWLMSAEFDLA